MLHKLQWYLIWKKKESEKCQNWKSKNDSEITNHALNICRPRVCSFQHTHCRMLWDKSSSQRPASTEIIVVSQDCACMKLKRTTVSGTWFLTRNYLSNSGALPRPEWLHSLPLDTPGTRHCQLSEHSISTRTFREWYSANQHHALRADTDTICEYRKCFFAGCTWLECALLALAVHPLKYFFNHIQKLADSAPPPTVGSDRLVVTDRFSSE